MDTTYLLPHLLHVCYPLVLRQHSRQEERWHTLFTSVPGVDNVDASLVSNYMRGKQAISRHYALHYADLAHPRCPQQLLADVAKNVSGRSPTASERINCRKQMIAYCDRYVDPLDHVLLRPNINSHTPTQEDIITMLTRMIWHAICHDIAGC